MIRAILWKEWHEHRSKYIAYWLALNAPVLLVAIAVAIGGSARAPFTDLSNSTVMKYLPLALVEPLFLATLFLLATSGFALATFGPEIRDRSLFFVYEQPVSPARYVGTKLVIYILHVVLAVCFATLFAVCGVYALMLLSGKVTWAGSAAAFQVVFAAAARAAVWCTLISLVAFTLSALIAALAPRWWIALAGSVAILALLVYAGGGFFNFLAEIPDGDPMSIGMSLSTGDTPWVTITRPVHFSEIAAFAQWRPLPLSIAALAAAALAFLTAQLCARKELT